MSSIIVATAREEVRRAVTLPLLREGVPVGTAADWARVCEATCATSTRLVLLDPELPGARGDILAALVSTLPHRPLVRSLGAPLHPLPRVALTERSLLRLARQAAGGAALDADERRMVALQGLGEQAMERLVRLAASELPVLLHGERGTGKERVARVLHRLGGAAGPLVVLRPDEAWTPGAPAGSVYLESVHRRPEDLRALIANARTHGWRVLAGTRLPEAVPGIKWERVLLPPLRDRPDDLRRLALHWLDLHARRMGLPRRAFDRGMWALLAAHRWPGNHRELEMFVLQVLNRVDAATVRAAELPDDLRTLLSPAAEAEREAESFEDMARLRLAPVVRAYTPGGGESLHDLVIGSAERALIQLVLARTQGNRKQAAALLGVARNTLQARMVALGISVAGGRGEP
jgi:DNA-binding NtrC family response regulator